MVLDAGLNDIMDVYFGDQSKISTWYVGFISSSGFTGIATGDTPGSHAGWTEFTGYSESARPTWVPSGDPAGGVLNNPTDIEITPSGDATIIGYFLASTSTKGATTGRMPIAEYFDTGPRDVKAGATEKFNLTITLERR